MKINHNTRTIRLSKDEIMELLKGEELKFKATGSIIMAQSDSVDTLSQDPPIFHINITNLGLVTLRETGQWTVAVFILKLG